MLNPEDVSQLRKGLVLASAGIELAIAIVVGYFGGKWLDTKLDTTPILTYVFLACGMAAGFRGLWRTARGVWPKDETDAQ